jgi:protein-S-isoprenylcysteine O-methyltransferase Ste14
MLELGCFLVVSAGLIYVSRKSLRRPRTHGFCRFFAWECLLALCLLNLRRWFVNPWSVPQLISWLLLVISAGLAIHGVVMLRRRGQPRDDRRDDALIGLERTTALVAEGAYRYIRHPLYSSLFFLGWGVFCKDLTWLGGALAVAATLFLVITAKVEEAEDLRFFGPLYQAYMRRTKRFIPFIF